MGKITTKAIALLITLSVATFAQQKSTFTDSRDKKSYKTVKIGEQTWMAENLNYAVDCAKCYNDGDSYYDNNWNKIPFPPAEIQANCDKYGRLYNWETAMKACPSGWHLPSGEEWDKLLHYVDGSNGTESPYESKTAGKYLKAKKGWNKNGNGKNGNGKDKFNFSALPGGFGSSGDHFNNVGDNGGWWSASEYNSKYVYSRGMLNDGEYVNYGINDKSSLFSVRCVQD